MDSSNVISLTKARKEQAEERRRKYERVLFRQILGAYCVAEGEGLKAVELVDVSPEGLSFQLPADSKNRSTFTSGKSMIFRFYFSQDTFIPVGVKIENERECIENHGRYVRFGCSVDSSLQSYDAYLGFVNFLQKYSENMHQDKGEMKIYYF